MRRIKEAHIIDKNERFLKDDPLQFLIHPMGIHTKIANLCVVNSIKLAIVIYAEIYNVVETTACFIFSKDWADFTRHAALTLLLQMGASSSITSILYWEDFRDWPTLVKKHCWSFDSVGWKTHKKILHQLTTARMFFIMHLVFGVLVHLTFTPIFGKLVEVDFTCVLIEKYTKSKILAITAQLLFYCIIVHFGYTMAGVFVAYVYPAMHIKFQFQLLQDYIRQMSWANMYENDTQFQKAIHNKLLKCIQQHIRLKKYIILVQDSAKWPLLLLFSGGTCAMSGGLILLLVGALYDNIVRTFVLGSTLVVVWYLTCKIGQTIQDESDLMYDMVCRCPWNSWNKQNRRAYMMLLIHSQKTVKYTCMDLIDVGYSTMVISARMAYSLATVFASVKMK